MPKPFSLSQLAATLVFFSTAFFSIAQQASDQTNDSQVSFAQCVADLHEQALQAGVSESVAHAALDDVQQVAKVLEYDRNQPEFVQSFPDYLSARVTDWRISKGRQYLHKHHDLLMKLTRLYGVPAHYLIAFWGLETNYGNYKGKMPIIGSLATLACDPRRSEFFTTELITALKLMQRENLQKSTMIGSWAGAMGHTQFMPSAYINYAIDGDDDGRIDLWESEPDALSSAANFLNKLGWTRGLIWGREVQLPDNFDYAQTGKENRLSLTQWQQFGVTKNDGSQLPSSDILGSILLPTGYKGPAFLVYANFDTILRWNNSESYALAVGYLADRILGKAPLAQSFPEIPSYPISTMVTLQEKLNELGFDVGKADGIVGPATRKGIRQFQLANNMIADGFASKQTIQAIIGESLN